MKKKEYVKKAQEKFNAGEFEELLKLSDDALKEDINNEDAYYWKGNALYELGKYEKAIKSYEMVIKLNPKNIETYNNIGNAFSGLKDFKNACKYYSKALKIDPDYRDAIFNKGLTLFDLESYEDAIKFFNKCLKLDPEDYKSHFHKGLSYLCCDKSDKALNCLDNAISINPKSAEAWHFKGVMLQILNDFNSSLKYFDKALELDPNYLDAYIEKGRSLYFEKKDDKALNSFEKALELDPKNILALYYMGNIYYDKNEFKKALEYYNECIKIDSDCERAWYKKGLILNDNEEFKEALECFMKSVEINPLDAESLLEIANVLRLMDKIDESNEAYEKFVKTVKDNKISDLYLKARRVVEYLNWLKENGEVVTFSPRDEPQYWQWVTKPEYFLEYDGSEREALNPNKKNRVVYNEPGSWWTCHKDTRAGDLVLLYRAGEKDGKIYRDIKYLIMATSDAYPINDITNIENWHYGCEYLSLFKFENSLTFDEIKKDPYLHEWNAFKKNFQGISFKTEESIWKHLTDVLIDKNPEYKTFLDKFDRRKIMAKIIDEKEVEDELAKKIDILEDFGYKLKNPKQQKPCTGDGGYIDILAEDKKTGEYVVIELKVVRASREVFGQISSYMGWVMKHLSNKKPIKGIVISPGYDSKFASSLLTNPLIEHIELSEILAKLGMKLL